MHLCVHNTKRPNSTHPITVASHMQTMHHTTHYRPSPTTTEWACMHCTVSPPDTTVTGPLTSEGRSRVVLHQMERKVLFKRRQLLWQHPSPVHLRTSLSPSVTLLLASSIACGAWEVTQMSLAGSCVQLMHKVKVPC